MILIILNSKSTFFSVEFWTGLLQSCKTLGQNQMKRPLQEVDLQGVRALPKIWKNYTLKNVFLYYITPKIIKWFYYKYCKKGFYFFVFVSHHHLICLLHFIEILLHQTSKLRTIYWIRLLVFAKKTQIYWLVAMQRLWSVSLLWCSHIEAETSLNSVLWYSTTDGVLATLYEVC